MNVYKDKQREKENDRRYYLRNKTKLNANCREYYRKNKEKITIQAKTYRQQYREKLCEKQKKYYQTHKEERNKYAKQYRETHKDEAKEQHEKQRMIILKLIGSKCVICGSTEKIHFHEIHDKRHPQSGLRNQWVNYVLAHPKDFISLCSFHHTILHRLIENRKYLNALIELLPD